MEPNTSTAKMPMTDTAASMPVTETASVTNTAAMEKEAMTIASALTAFKGGATIRELERHYQEFIKPGKKIDYAGLKIGGMGDILAYLQRQGKAKEVSPGKWAADHVPGAEHMKAIVEQTKSRQRRERRKKSGGQSWKGAKPGSQPSSKLSQKAQAKSMPANHALFCLHCRKEGHESSSCPKYPQKKQPVIQNKSSTSAKSKTKAESQFTTQERNSEQPSFGGVPQLNRSRTPDSTPPEDPIGPTNNRAPVDATRQDSKGRLLGTLEVVLGWGGRTFPELRKAYEMVSGRQLDRDVVEAGYPRQLSLIEADGPCDIQGGLVVLKSKTTLKSGRNTDNTDNGLTQEPDSTSLYIANLPVHWSESHLADMLKSVGSAVSIRILRNHVPNQDSVSQGIAIICMESTEQCHQVINMFNGKTLPGAGASDALQVQFADSEDIGGTGDVMDPYGSYGADIDYHLMPATGLTYPASTYLPVLPQGFLHTGQANPAPGAQNLLGDQLMGYDNGAINSAGMAGLTNQLTNLYVYPATDQLMQYGLAAFPMAAHLVHPQPFLSHQALTYDCYEAAANMLDPGEMGT